jgi:hypothetical protein
LLILNTSSASKDLTISDILTSSDITSYKFFNNFICFFIYSRNMI